MRDKRFTFTRSNTMYGPAMYAQCTTLRQTELCFSGVQDFFAIPYDLMEFDIVLTEYAVPGAYRIGVDIDPDMEEEAGVEYTIPTIGGHDIVFLMEMDRHFTDLWHRGYNYVHLELAA